jgi:hypothetical protein
MASEQGRATPGKDSIGLRDVEWSRIMANDLFDRQPRPIGKASLRKGR